MKPRTDPHPDALDRALLRALGPAYYDTYIKQAVHRRLTAAQEARVWYEKQVAISDEYRAFLADRAAMLRRGKSIDAATLSRTPATTRGLMCKIV